MYEWGFKMMNVLREWGGRQLDTVYEFGMKHKKIIFWLFMIFMFCLMTVYFYIIPYSEVDDTTYMVNLATGQQLTCIQDIIESQLSHWSLWSGRVLAHGHLQLMFLLGKPFLSAQMSFVLLFIPIMISKIVDKYNRINSFVVLSSASLFYFMNPVWGEVLWVTGFQVYVSTTAWILLFIYMFIQNIKFKKKSNTILNNVITLSILGFMVGCSIEAMSVSMIAVTFIMLLKMHKENLLQAKHISAFIFMLLGTSILILAPGNSIRAAYINTIDPAFSFHNICVRIFNFLTLICKEGIGVFILLVISYHFANKDLLHKENLFGEYILIAILAILAMFAAPQGFVTRVFIPIMSILFIAIHICVRDINLGIHKKLINQIVIYSYVGYMIMMVYGMVLQLFQVI